MDVLTRRRFLVASGVVGATALAGVPPLSASPTCSPPPATGTPRPAPWSWSRSTAATTA
ncbi:twin-arginine translocation signal domain-containing protein [Micromonospora schwarzwaldensis]